MLRRVAPAIGLVVLIAATASVAWFRSVVDQSTNPAPKVLIEGDLTHEFRIKLNEAIGTWSWVVKNVGQADLELWMKSSMDSTSTKLSGGKVTLKPGESTEIDLVWKTGHKGSHYRRHLTIGTNDPNLAWFTLSAHGVENVERRD